MNETVTTRTVLHHDELQGCWMKDASRPFVVLATTHYVHKDSHYIDGRYSTREGAMARRRWLDANR